MNVVIGIKHNPMKQVAPNKRATLKESLNSREIYRLASFYQG